MLCLIPSISKSCGGFPSRQHTQINPKQHQLQPNTRTRERELHHCPWCPKEKMAQQELLRCSVCLDGLKNPVTIPCGHSYCMSCIQNCWDINKERKTNSCPQCRQSFKTRPALVKNTILSELVEDLKKPPFKATLPALSGAAGPGDVPCDFCTGIKLKALKSCLQCTASFCEQHLQPHFTVALMRKHKLTEGTLSFQDNICSRHDEVMRIFCRTDQQCICYLCLMGDHKGHDTVPAETERAKRQQELEASQ